MKEAVEGVEERRVALDTQGSMEAAKAAAVRATVAAVMVWAVVATVLVAAAMRTKFVQENGFLLF